MDRNELAIPFDHVIGINDMAITTTTHPRTGSNTRSIAPPHQGAFTHEGMASLSQPMVRKRPFGGDGGIPTPTGEDVLKQVLGNCGSVSAYVGPAIPVEMALDLFRSIRI